MQRTLIINLISGQTVVIGCYWIESLSSTGGNFIPLKLKKKKK